MSYRSKLFTSAASVVAPSPFGGLSEPLLAKKHDEDVGDVHADDNDEDDPWSSIGFIIGAVILSAAGITASTAAMVNAAGMVVVYLAGGICVANSATIVRNQFELSKGKGYREGINNLRKVANKLVEQTELLNQAVDELQNEADLMQGLEEQLDEIASSQGSSTNEIIMMVRENEEILSKQKANLRQTFLSSVARAFTSSEFLLGDRKVDLKNLPVLILRLEVQLSAHGIRLNSEKFNEMVRREGNDVGSVFKICGDMLALNDKGDKDPAIMDVVTLDQQHSKGSVEAARGKAPTMLSRSESGNKVVRDVKRSLSMKGIEIDLEGVCKPRRQQQQRRQGETDPAKTTGKYRFIRGSKKKESDYNQDSTSAPKSRTKFAGISGMIAHRRTGTADKALNARMISKPSVSSSSSTGKSNSHQPRRAYPGRRGMSPGRQAADDGASRFSSNTRKARKSTSRSCSVPTHSHSGGSSGKSRRATMSGGTRKEAPSSVGGRRRMRDSSSECTI